MATKNTRKSTKTTTAPTTTTAPAPVKIKHDPEEWIPCRSVTVGMLVLFGPRTRQKYKWVAEDDVIEVMYQDLAAWKATKHKSLLTPMFLIEDESLVEEWGKDLKPVYENFTNGSLRGIFTLTDRQFYQNVKKLSENATMAGNLKNMAHSMIQSGELDSLVKIKTLDELLGTEFVQLLL